MAKSTVDIDELYQDILTGLSIAKQYSDYENKAIELEQKWFEIYDSELKKIVELKLSIKISIDVNNLLLKSKKIREISFEIIEFLEEFHKNM
jgi:uncharacterized protein related to proFAR isomerase